MFFGQRLRQGNVPNVRRFRAAETLHLEDLGGTFIRKGFDHRSADTGEIADLAHGNGTHRTEGIVHLLLLRRQLALKIRHGTDHSGGRIVEVACRCVFTDDDALFQQFQKRIALFVDAEFLAQLCTGQSLLGIGNRHEDLPAQVVKAFAVVILERSTHAVSVDDLIADPGGDHQLHSFIERAVVAALHPKDQRQHFGIEQRFRIQHGEDRFQLCRVRRFPAQVQYHSHAGTVAGAKGHGDTHTGTHGGRNGFRHNIGKGFVKAVGRILHRKPGKQQRQNSFSAGRWINPRSPAR